MKLQSTTNIDKGISLTKHDVRLKKRLKMPVNKWTLTRGFTQEESHESILTKRFT